MTDNILESDYYIFSLRNLCTAIMQREGRDLSSRQLSILLTCYLQQGPHTVRALAAELSATKPEITRALNCLESFDLLRRKINPIDHRRVVIQRTKKGIGFIHQLRQTIVDMPQVAKFKATGKVAA
jgi:DNA-binding MarR family transcriptional regulator